jgi:hypothetical protein
VERHAGLVMEQATELRLRNSEPRFGNRSQAISAEARYG